MTNTWKQRLESIRAIGKSIDDAATNGCPHQCDGDCMVCETLAEMAEKVDVIETAIGMAMDRGLDRIEGDNLGAA